MSLPRYEAYKDSGIPWLGEIPAHWELTSLKRRAKLHSGSTPKSDNSAFWGGNIEWYTPEDLGKNSAKVIGSSQRKITQAGYDNCGVSLTPVNTMLVSTRAPIGHLAITPGDSCINQGCRALVFYKDNPDYFFYLLHAGKEDLKSFGQGTTFMELPKSKMEGFSVGIPPLPEQRAIAAYLDERTAKLDKLIANKRGQISQLETLRKVTIHDAVTKGLNPDAPMKDSGIPWLGEIPAHWEVKRLKKAITFQRGHDLPDHVRQEGTVPVASSGGITGRHNELRAKGPGIVTGRYGTIGQFQYIDEDYWPLNTVIYSIKTWSNLVRYLWYMLHPISDIFLMLSGKSAVPGVDRKDIHEIHAAIPPFPEQRAIAAYLDEQTAKLDKLIANKRKQISQLETLRKVTIHDAVTGKVKVI